MHVGIDASNIRQGGGVTHLVQLLEEADPLIYGIDKITIWCSTDLAKKLPKKTWLNVKIESWLDCSLFIRLIWQQFVLPKNIDKEFCDVLFSPGGTLPALCALPTVTVCQNMLPFEPEQAKLFGKFSLMRLKMFLLRHSQGKSFMRSDGVIFLTDYARNTISRSVGGILGKHIVIPHGVEKRFFQKPKAQSDCSEFNSLRPFKLLYVSILMPYKHQIEVAEAVCELVSEGLPIEIDFVGPYYNKYYSKFCKTLQDLDPEGKCIHYLGEKSFKQLHLLYQEADFFIFGSSCENLPNILIESMASGLPIASSNLGPMPEILGNAGLYFNPYDINSIKQAIKTAYDDVNLRSSLSSKAWQRSQQYSWSNSAKETMKFISELACK